MSDPHRLSITLTMPSGAEYRWSPDERDVENVPSGLTFSTSIPGGFSTATLTLPRGIVKDYPDEALFADVKITGAGGRVAWEGRVASLPREQGSSRTLTVGCVGWAAHLKDNQAFREIYVDRTLNKWGEPSLARRAALIAANYALTSPSTAVDGLRLSFNGNNGWSSSGLPTCEAWYGAAGIPIGSVYYSWTKGSKPSAGDSNWSWSVLAASDDTASAYDTSGNLRAAGPGSGTLAATTAARDWAVAAFSYNTASAGSGDVDYDLYFNDLAVYGTHGLTKRGTEPSAGFYLSDIVSDVIPRAAPLLNLGSIEQTSYVIPQAVYDGVTAEDVILDANKYELKRCGVWEGRAFDLWTASSSTRTVWEARLSEGAQVQLEGDNAESVINGVVVRYTDPYGKPRVIAPTGYTPADTTSDNLLIADTSNAATAAGLQKYAVLSLSFPTDASGAEQIGAVYLAEQNLPQRRGTVNLTGLVRHPTLGPVPAWVVRAGDFIRIADRPNDSPREITATGYQHDSHTVSATVGGLPATIEALLERVGVNTVNL